MEGVARNHGLLRRPAEQGRPATTRRLPLRSHSRRAAPVAKYRDQLPTGGLPTGVVLGTVEPVDVVQKHPSKWAERE
jgi:hypothetical protein